MFNICPIRDFRKGGNLKRIKTTSKCSQTRTTIERQKDSRYHFLFSYRHFDTNWSQTEDLSDGYDSDHSSDSISSSVSLDQISPKDVFNALLSCEPLPQFESVLRTALKQISHLIGVNADNYDFNGITQIMDQLFDSRFLNKMSTFIGSEGVSLSAQIKVLELYINSVNGDIPLDECIQNLINSSMIPKLFETLVSGNNYLVDKSLNFIMSALKMSNSMALMTHVLNSGFIEVVVIRMDQLKTKRLIVNSSDLKSSRRQTITENNMSSMVKILFRLFSRSISELLSIDLVNPFKAQLLSRLTPLLSRLLCCPDEKVVPNAIDSIKHLVENCELNIALAVVDSFGRSLLSFTQRNEESIVLTVLQLFYKLLTNFPQLIIYKTFGSGLIQCLERVLSLKRNEKFNKEIINLIESVVQRLDISNESIRQSFDFVLNLIMIVFKSENRENRMNAILTFEIILSKYCFRDFKHLLNAFDIKELMTRLLMSAQNVQQIGLRIIDKLLNILSTNFDEFPEQTQQLRHLLFGRQTDVYLSLEKLSFKTINQSLSKTASYLIQRIDSPLNTDQDLSIMPQIKDNLYVFGSN